MGFGSNFGSNMKNIKNFIVNFIKKLFQEKKDYYKVKKFKTDTN
jgi:hypothetical protein